MSERKKISVIDLDPTGGGTRLSNEQIELLACGGAKLTIRYTDGFHEPRSVKLNVAERKAFEDAKRDGYHYAKPLKVGVLAHYWQEANDRPMVRVETVGKTSNVTMDLISCSRSRQEQWRLRHEDVLHLGGKLKYFGVYTAIAVPTERAPECAKQLVEMFNDDAR